MKKTKLLVLSEGLFSEHLKKDPAKLVEKLREIINQDIKMVFPVSDANTFLLNLVNLNLDLKKVAILGLGGCTTKHNYKSNFSKLIQSTLIHEKVPAQEALLVSNSPRDFQVAGKVGTKFSLVVSRLYKHVDTGEYPVFKKLSDFIV